MKLTKRHIGGLFTCAGADGSWVYQLIDIKQGWLLFYNFGSANIPYYKEKVGQHKDWFKFVPLNPWPNNWLEYGWKDAKDR